MTQDKPTAQLRRPRGTGSRPVRGVRVTDKDWELAKRRAHGRDKVTLSVAISRLAGAYAAHAIDLPRDPRLTIEAPSRSHRLADDEWEAVRKRSTTENFTPSAALSRLIIGYARGAIRLPKMVYVRKGREAKGTAQV